MLLQNYSLTSLKEPWEVLLCPVTKKWSVSTQENKKQRIVAHFYDSYNKVLSSRYFVNTLEEKEIEEGIQRRNGKIKAMNGWSSGEKVREGEKEG